MHFVENNRVTYNRRPVQQSGERKFIPRPNVFVSNLICFALITP